MTLETETILVELYNALQDHAPYMSTCDADTLRADSCTCCRLQFASEQARRELEALSEDPEPARFGTAACLEASE